MPKAHKPSVRKAAGTPYQDRKGKAAAAQNMGEQPALEEPRVLLFPIQIETVSTNCSNALLHIASSKLPLPNLSPGH